MSECIVLLKNKNYYKLYASLGEDPDYFVQHLLTEAKKYNVHPPTIVDIYSCVDSGKMLYGIEKKIEELYEINLGLVAQNGWIWARNAELRSIIRYVIDNEKL